MSCNVSFYICIYCWNISPWTIRFSPISSSIGVWGCNLVFWNFEFPVIRAICVGKSGQRRFETLIEPL